MKRVLFTSSLAAVALAALTMSVFADGRPPVAFAGRHEGGHELQRLRRCLSQVDLSADLKTAIQAIVAAAQPGLTADAAALKADHDKIHADIAAGADKSVVGQDVLTAHADAEKLRADAGAVRDQILAKLSPDQQSKVNACLQAVGHGMRGSRGAGLAGGDHQN